MTGSETDFVLQDFFFRRFGHAYLEGLYPDACILEGVETYWHPHANAATTAANKAEEQRAQAETSRVQAEEARNHTFTQWTAEEEKWSENETTRIQNETKRQADTADAIAKAKEATELLVNQANTIAFRINEGDSGLDVVILSA